MILKNLLHSTINDGMIDKLAILAAGKEAEFGISTTHLFNQNLKKI
ncbi:MAG: hypothetical protein MRQ11_04375 [Candidatus Midichloria mitochondrii]|nr:hypothetical protein [Candidatus Midichloria mitochondrii]MDJ1256665.1 hypothetical protein [Candidatus Midichloria mitochondrii]MDJ1288387.1 hypothetical protein [Candidatus Midichloria mitochondrii]MDJ1299226.1 hypothetical protein [Candidatus Midichloria mitochondrii]MDJ1313352.1 hypothetical protein [Candidatus Midichloria mitochondrii]MDJ1583909.1 hypothetical protein [Candidatus Midichloria mitochondrii]